jgi:hypothetical protein
MLATLVAVHPEGRQMLAKLRHDRVLGPIAVTALLEEGDLRPDDLTAEEQLSLLAEGLIVLLELGGPEQVAEQVTEMAGGDALEMFEAVLSSGHPADEAMEELRTLVAEPMRARPRRLRLVSSPAPGARGRPTGHGKKRKR